MKQGRIRGFVVLGLVVLVLLALVPTALAFDERSGDRVTLKIEGVTKGSAGEGWWQSANGVVTRLLGTATFDLAQGAFVDFECVALGRRWGQTRFNGRGRAPESGPLGSVIRLAKPDAPRIAPAWIFAYDADWVVRPPGR